jgi:hypothetical protein
MTADNVPLATSAATAPAITEPMTGTNAPRKTSVLNGAAKGTPMITSPKPMPVASTNATATVPRMSPRRRAAFPADTTAHRFSPDPDLSPRNGHYGEGTLGWPVASEPHGQRRGRAGEVRRRRLR